MLDQVKAAVSEELGRVGKETHLFMSETGASLGSIYVADDEAPSALEALKGVAAQMVKVKDVAPSDPVEGYRIGDRIVLLVGVVPDRGDNGVVLAIADEAGTVSSFGHAIEGKPDTLEWDLELGKGKLATRRR